MNFRNAKEVFEQYLKDYDREDEKIKLKIIHTYGVVKQSAELAQRMNLSKEDSDLAKMIALLHDIGRFEQIRQFDSFQPDTMDHAAYGVEILFGKDNSGGMIRRFVSNEKWDDIIRTAIARHSDFSLPSIQDKQAELHAKIIRDADKLDNCRVKLEDALKTFMGVSGEVIGQEEISHKVWDDVCQRKSIRSEDRVTNMDYWVSYLAYFYDLNFRESLDIVEENDYVRRIIRRIPYGNKRTADKMILLEKMMTEYIRTAKRSDEMLKNLK